ncbi:MAG: tyrosine-type recombinase/integrase [Spirochaetales bacterium]|nr:tyrosine-type recombinase/integrase [Spirochaetales bacterium]
MYKEGYAGSTINKALGCLRAILQTAEEAHLLRALPRIQRAGLNQKETGILTQDEVSRLFALEWEDHRCYVANLIAASTGFRLGEVLGIKRRNIIPGYIKITGSWSSRRRAFKPGLKNGQRSRTVPIPDSAETAIQELLKTSPWISPDSYLLFTKRTEEKPMEHIRATRAFAEMLTKLDPPITQEERTRRSIHFHSHRHFFNSLLIESRIPLQKIQRLTGHLSEEMTQLYYHTDDLSDVAEVQMKVFDFSKYKQGA